MILDLLSLDYHETLMAPSGKQAEETRLRTLQTGGYLLVVEGSIPTGEGGIYCCVGGKSAVDLLKEAASNALAVIAVGSCACYGGLSRAQPNPTHSLGVVDLVSNKSIVNLPGCPSNAVNLTATLVHFLTFNHSPAVDEARRPLFAYGNLIHDHCERRGHFDRGEFVKSWGDAGHRDGWCLYQMGCCGPVTAHNCPSVRWNDGVNWPIGAGHPCIGCSEAAFWDHPFYTPVGVKEFAPPATYAPIRQPTPAIPTNNAISTGVVGGAILTVAGIALANTLRSARKDVETEIIEPCEKPQATQPSVDEMVSEPVELNTEDVE
jgi:hydrogenase small subunit